MAKAPVPTPEIAWQTASETSAPNAVSASIAINNNGLVVAVVLADSGAIFYMAVSIEDGSIDWQGAFVQVSEVEGADPDLGVSAAMNDTTVLIKYIDLDSQKLTALNGTFGSHQVINWQTPFPIQDQVGSGGSISLNDKGNVLEFHQGQGKTELFYSSGVCENASGGVLWKQSGDTDFMGTYPGCGINNHGDFVALSPDDKGHMTILNGSLKHDLKPDWYSPLPYTPGQKDLFGDIDIRDDLNLVAASVDNAGTLRVFPGILSAPGITWSKKNHTLDGPIARPNVALQQGGEYATLIYLDGKGAAPVYAALGKVKV